MRNTVAMPMRLLVPLVLGLTGAACDDPRDQAPRLTCDLAGVWDLEESRVEGTCEDEAVSGGRLEIEDHGGTFHFQYHAPGMTAMSCSGIPQGDSCLLKLTCSGAESGAEVAFEIEVDPEGDRLAGLRRMQLRDPACQATYELAGERSGS